MSEHSQGDYVQGDSSTDGALIAIEAAALAWHQATCGVGQAHERLSDASQQFGATKDEFVGTARRYLSIINGDPSAMEAFVKLWFLVHPTEDELDEVGITSQQQALGVLGDADLAVASQLAEMVRHMAEPGALVLHTSAQTPFGLMAIDEHIGILQRLEGTELDIDPDGTVQVVIPLPISYGLYTEGDEWRIDLTELSSALVVGEDEIKNYLRSLAAPPESDESNGLRGLQGETFRIAPTFTENYLAASKTLFKDDEDHNVCIDGLLNNIALACARCVLNGSSGDDPIRVNDISKLIGELEARLAVEDMKALCEKMYRIVTADSGTFWPKRAAPREKIMNELQSALRPSQDRTSELGAVGLSITD